MCMAFACGGGGRGAVEAGEVVEVGTEPRNVVWVGEGGEEAHDRVTRGCGVPMDCRGHLALAGSSADSTSPNLGYRQSSDSSPCLQLPWVRPRLDTPLDGVAPRYRPSQPVPPRDGVGRTSQQTRQQAWKHRGVCEGRMGVAMHR